MTGLAWFLGFAFWALLERLEDRREPPRRWWFPIYPEPPAPEPLEEGASEEDRTRAKEEWDALVRAHEETSKTVRKTLFALLAFAFFCAFTLLGTPDRDLIAAGSKLPVPIPLVARYDMSFVGFLIVGPLVLLGITVYLHVFLQHLRRLDSVPVDRRQPFVFNLPHGSSRALSHVLFYWLTPATLAVFSWKTLPLPDLGPVFFYGGLAAVAISVWEQIRRRDEEWRELNVLFWQILLLIVLAAPRFSEIRSVRSMDLVQADLRGLDLRDRILTGASLEEAKLCGANLSSAVLDGADLAGAQLAAGKRWDAVQEREVDCRAAQLRGASLRAVRLTSALLGGVDLGLADLSGADLRRAKLDGADLASAILVATNLAGADLSGADLQAARLGAADLGETKRLTQAQLNSTCNTIPESVPEALRPPPPCEMADRWESIPEAPAAGEDALLNPRLLIEGGTFLMGSRPGVGDPDEGPRHEVTLDSFCMQQHEVTNAEYARFDSEHSFWRDFKSHPAARVSWWEAMAYAAWIGGRLPTEAEWEYAARSRGREQQYPWGDAPADCSLAVVAGSHGMGCGWEGTWPVCSKVEGNSEQGLCDLSGNVWEWVLDWYEPYPAEPRHVSSRPPRESLLPKPSGRRVARGGSFGDSADLTRSASRLAFAPGYRLKPLGFRVVLPAPCGG